MDQSRKRPQSSPTPMPKGRSASGKPTPSPSTAPKRSASTSSPSPDDKNPYRHAPAGETASEHAARKKSYYSWQRRNDKSLAESGNTKAAGEASQIYGKLAKSGRQTVQDPGDMNPQDTSLQQQRYSNVQQMGGPMGKVVSDVNANAPALAGIAGTQLPQIVRMVGGLIKAASQAAQNAPRQGQPMQRPGMPQQPGTAMRPQGQAPQPAQASVVGQGPMRPGAPQPGMAGPARPALAPPQRALSDSRSPSRQAEPGASLTKPRQGSSARLNRKVTEGGRPSNTNLKSKTTDARTGEVKGSRSAVKPKSGPEAPKKKSASAKKSSSMKKTSSKKKSSKKKT